MEYLIIIFMTILLLSGLYSTVAHYKFWIYFRREYPERAHKFLLGGGIGVIVSFFRTLGIDDEKLILLQKKAKRAYVLCMSIGIAGALAFLGFIGLVVIVHHLK